MTEIIFSALSYIINSKTKMSSDEFERRKNLGDRERLTIDEAFEEDVSGFYFRKYIVRQRLN